MIPSRGIFRNVAELLGLFTPLRNQYGFAIDPRPRIAASKTVDGRSSPRYQSNRHLLLLSNIRTATGDGRIRISCCRNYSGGLGGISGIVIARVEAFQAAYVWPDFLTGFPSLHQLLNRPGIVPTVGNGQVDDRRNCEVKCAVLRV